MTSIGFKISGHSTASRNFSMDDTTPSRSVSFEDRHRRVSTKEWLLEPTAENFNSPSPAGSLTELSMGSYMYTGNPDKLLTDLHRCNHALRDLIMQNARLEQELKYHSYMNALQKKGHDQEVQVDLLSFDSSGTDDIDNAILHTSLRQQSQASSYLNPLFRWADQESAIQPYRDRLTTLSGQFWQVKYASEALQMEGLNALNSLARLEEQHVVTVLAAEEERELLVLEMEAREEEAQCEREAFLEQLRSVEKAAQRTKSKADAKIAELTLVIAASHLDVEELLAENKCLKDQLMSQRNAT